MARTNLTPNSEPQPYPDLPVTADSLDLAFTAADVANKNQFSPSGDDLVLAWNTGASPFTVTITSVADELKRTGDITAYSIGAGEIAVFRIKTLGYQQSDGKIYLEASDAAVTFAVVPV